MTIRSQLGGRGLSAGQAQRIALARALFRNPRYLILDEPNASLDAEGDAQLTQTIEEAKAAGTTILIVAHRMSVLPVVDTLARHPRRRDRACTARATKSCASLRRRSRALREPPNEPAQPCHPRPGSDLARLPAPTPSPPPIRRATSALGLIIARDVLHRPARLGGGRAARRRGDRAGPAGRVGPAPDGPAPRRRGGRRHRRARGRQRARRARS